MQSQNTNTSNPYQNKPEAATAPATQTSTTQPAQSSVDKKTKTNNTLLRIVKINITAYVAAMLIGFIMRALDGFRSDGVGGLLMLPFLLVAWALTPFGVGCLVALAFRTKRTVYVISSIFVLATPLWLRIYDLLTK